MIFINVIHFASIKVVNEGMLSWTYLVNIRCVHDQFWHVISELVHRSIPRKDLLRTSTISCVIGASSVASASQNASLRRAQLCCIVSRDGALTS